MFCNIISIGRGDLSTLDACEFYAFPGLGGQVIIKRKEYPLPDDAIDYNGMVLQVVIMICLIAAPTHFLIKFQQEQQIELIYLEHIHSGHRTWQFF